MVRRVVKKDVIKPYQWWRKSREFFKNVFRQKRSTRRSITIVERDADIVRIVGRGPRGEIEVITSMAREGDTLILRGTHIEGPGPGTLGIGEIRTFARELGRQQGVRRVKIFGGTRTTGATPGRTPHPIVMEVNEDD